MSGPGEEHAGDPRSLVALLERLLAEREALAALLTAHAADAETLRQLEELRVRIASLLERLETAVPPDHPPPESGAAPES